MTRSFGCSMVSLPALALAWPASLRMNLSMRSASRKTGPRPLYFVLASFYPMCAACSSSHGWPCRCRPASSS